MRLARAGKGGLGAGEVDRLTGCFEDEYEFHWWSNVVCARRDHFMYPELEKLSSRYALYRNEYYLSPIASAAA